MNISEYSVRRPIAVLMATISVLVLGYISLGRLPLTLLPEMSRPNLNVFVSYPSSSPEEVQRNITRPLEEYLSTLNGLQSIRSTSSSSGANVSLEFREGTDMDLASLDVRDRIDQVRNRLPLDVERVSIRRWQTTDMPVFRFAVAWRGEREELFGVIEDLLRPRLERIDGVANVDVRGVEARQVIVELDERRLEAHGIDVFNLGQALRSGNVNLSGGYVIEGDRKYSLRTVGEFQTAEEIARLPLLRGRLILADVAEVRYDFPERTSFSRLDGNDAVTVSVFKASTANVVRVCTAVREELERIQKLPGLDGQLGVRVFHDQAEPILSTLGNLRTAGIYGGSLAMVVLFLFLMKFRSMLIISLAIPVSIVFTFAFMYLLRVVAGSEVSLNTITLMGLMIAVGMVVDASVVVLENIFRHKQDEGLSAMEASVVGSREVGMPVLASTATTVVVFASFVFMPSAISGRWNKDFGMAVSVSLVAALIVALTLIPLISSRLFTGPEKPKQRVIQWLTRVYGSLMRVLLRWRFVALILLAGLGYASYALFGSIDREFMRPVAEREVRFGVQVERSYSVDDMREIFAHLEDLLLERREELEIESISSNFNTRTTRRGQYRGDLNILLTSEGGTPTAELRDRILALFPRFPGVEYQAGRMRHFGGGGEMGVSVELKGEDAAMLALYAEEIRERISQIPGLNTVQTSLEMGDDEIHLSVDRERLEKFGLSSLAVARAISSTLSTRATTRLKGDSGEIDVILQLRGADQFSLDELLNMGVENREGNLVPLHSIVDYQYQRGPISIRRDDRKAVVNVSADTDRGGGTFFVSQEIRQVLAGLGLPPGYSAEMGQSWRQARQSEEESLFAIVLALILIYIIMAALFENFLHPLTILFTVPFSIIGVALVFHLTGTPLSQTAYLGILVLFGIVVNNGILLVDRINKLRRGGLSRDGAIIRGGMDRLRPILMTACTTGFSLLPLSLPYIFPGFFPALGGRAGMWAPVSLAVLGGLTTSTFFTLIILPSVYSYMDDLSRGASWLALRLANPVRFLRGEMAPASPSGRVRTQE